MQLTRNWNRSVEVNLSAEWFVNGLAKYECGLFVFLDNLVAELCHKHREETPDNLVSKI